VGTRGKKGAEHCITMSFMICTLRYATGEIKSRTWRVEAFLLGKPEGNGSLRRRRPKWRVILISINK
jgi:hypothetical protein